MQIDAKMPNSIQKEWDEVKKRAEEATANSGQTNFGYKDLCNYDFS